MNYIRCFLLLLVVGCTNKTEDKESSAAGSKIYLTVLGIVQDGGYPHINNPKEFEAVKQDSKNRKYVVSLGLVDTYNGKKFLFEATPDMPFQLNHLENEHLKTQHIIDGVFLTHAHIGHYAGLMHFGREAMGAVNIPVYAMPKMRQFLENNGPWLQLVKLKNIQLNTIFKDSTINITSRLKVTPFLVPHRDEFSETVGYKIEGPNKSALFIPDIDKWEKWNKNIVDEVKKVDYALIDATFFADGEIPRPMSEVPHPFIQETVDLFKDETYKERSKIVFIHFNHSNPVLELNFGARRKLEKEGYQFAFRGMNLPL
ncbi:MBL fold metallo-hydrolase [Spongiivirga sp. MCCC 1A20706]|uniref:MBL fold metallo-hydrolase n=1 Tax=Spongiivirga sp. MCCC 1A20706 TaxID=3160963 RepID=UPI0039774B42